MTPSNKILSDLVSFRTYSKYIPHLERREVLPETINRVMTMHLDKFPKLSKPIMKAFKKVHDLEVMPSMRTLQFAGDPILKNSARGYNCSATTITHPRKFSEILFLLLSGTGVGYSLQKRHISQLPNIRPTTQEGRFVVQDSIQGWSQATQVLMDAYFYGTIRPTFDFSDISPKGTQLNTTGAKAPGPEPLKYMLNEVEKRLKFAIGRQLRSIEVHDIICIISDCVLAGGIRRSSLIALFDRDDYEMLKCKSGSWWEKHPYRARANNSAVLMRGEVTKDEFMELFRTCKDSNAGEPGFFWTNDYDLLTNPCAEISLNPDQFCNLTIVNQTGILSKEDFLSRIYSATVLGTIQASYTNFPYLSESWKRQTEAEALLGISFTGIADSNGIVTAEWLREGAKLALEVNAEFAKKIGINQAARITAIKPEGSSSLVLGSSSGIHSRKSKYYLRRVQINKDDAMYLYLLATVPNLIEDAIGVPNTAVITVPQESPDNAPTEDKETAMQLFNRVMMYQRNWITPGHRSGKNKHNVSVTITPREDEWSELAEAMWDKRDLYTGISLFPFDNGSYQQAPFESCDKDTFDKYYSQVKELDLTQVRERENLTNMIESVSCAGGACEITWLK
jgi:ribonucleoside-diphosphate reductase alpha chain